MKPNTKSIDEQLSQFEGSRSGLSETELLNQEKYYKKFDFFYRRTAFRTMTEYYKGLFKPNLDRFREVEKKLTKGDF